MVTFFLRRSSFQLDFDINIQYTQNENWIYFHYLIIKYQ